MKTVVLDGNTVTRIEEIYDLLAQELAFPDWFGRNLDALYDCLTDVSEDVRIEIAGKDSLAFTLGWRGDVLFRLLFDAADQNRHLSVSVLS